jgi:hypothetical protein
MQRYQPVLFSVRPAGQNLIGTVTLYEPTWQNHIIVKHPEVAGRLADIEMIAAYPSVIYASKSVAGAFLFVRTGIVDSGGRSLRVVVPPSGSISTAYFSSAAGGSQLWP